MGPELSIRPLVCYSQTPAFPKRFSFLIFMEKTEVSQHCGAVQRCFNFPEKKITKSVKCYDSTPSYT